MKTLRNLILSALLLTGLVLTPGMTCNPSQQAVAYKSIYSVELTTRAAFDAYLDQAVKQVPPDTNGLTRAAFAFNTFQAASRVATDAAQGNTNAPASQSLLDAQSKAMSTFKKGTP